MELPGRNYRSAKREPLADLRNNRVCVHRPALTQRIQRGEQALEAVQIGAVGLANATEVAVLLESLQAVVQRLAANADADAQALHGGALTELLAAENLHDRHRLATVEGLRLKAAVVVQEERRNPLRAIQKPLGPSLSALVALNVSLHCNDLSHVEK